MGVLIVGVVVSVMFVMFFLNDERKMKAKILIGIFGFVVICIITTIFPPLALMTVPLGFIFRKMLFSK